MKGVKKVAKPFVNYFISIPIRNNVILGSLKCVGNQYLKEFPKNGKGVTSWKKSHLTICVFHLGETEIENAKILLTECAESIRNNVQEKRHKILYKNPEQQKIIIFLIQKNFKQKKIKKK